MKRGTRLRVRGSVVCHYNARAFYFYVLNAVTSSVLMRENLPYCAARRSKLAELVRSGYVSGVDSQEAERRREELLDLVRQGVHVLLSWEAEVLSLLLLGERAFSPAGAHFCCTCRSFCSFPCRCCWVQRLPLCGMGKLLKDFVSCCCWLLQLAVGTGAPPCRSPS